MQKLPVALRTADSLAHAAPAPQQQGDVVVGEVHRKARQPFHIAAAVHDRFAQRRLHARRAVRAERRHPFGALTQVHKVVLRRGGELAYAAAIDARAHDLRIGVARQPFPKLGEKRVHGRVHALHGAQIHAGQREHGHVIRVTGVHGLVLRKAAVDGQRADVAAVHARLDLSQKGIVPALRRLRLLRGDEVVRVGGEEVRRLHRAHQAGVEAEVVQPLPALQRVGDLKEGQAVAVLARVAAKALQGAVAVIPEDQAGGIGGREIAREVEKAAQRLRRAHRPLGQRGHGRERPALEAVDDVVRPGTGQVRKRLRRAAGQQQHAGVRADVRVQHFLQILGGIAALLQVRADHVDKDGVGVVRLRPRGQKRERQKRRENDDGPAHMVHLPCISSTSATNASGVSSSV